MKKSKKNLMFAIFLVLASVFGYYLDAEEEKSYTLESDMLDEETAVSQVEEVFKEEKININTATSSELQTLEGIGEKKAENIIKYRETKRKFETIHDIKKVSGIGDGIFEDICEHITV